MDKLALLNKTGLRTDLPALKAGMKVRVWQRIKEADNKERLQAFEGIVIAMKHGSGKTATFTVRKVSSGIGVERVFPMHSPMIAKIEVLSQAKVRSAKLYYLRDRIGKKARINKQKELAEVIAALVAEEPKETEEIKEEK